jgi:RNA polymerase sigma-70 factor (sigma-E family)
VFVRQHHVDGPALPDVAAPSAVAATPDLVLTPVSLAELFSAHSRRLVGALTVYTGDRGEAEDLVQEAFARVHGSPRRLRDPDRMVSYLYSVAFNLARTRWRRQRSLGRALQRLGRSAEAGPDIAAASLQASVAEETTAAVTALPERQRACVVLHYYTELSVAETAAALGISTNSVKTHLRRALSSLRTALVEEDPS